MSRRGRRAVSSVAIPPEGLLCLYPHRQCLLQRLEGYEFCQKHISEDQRSTFAACKYKSSRTGRRCTQTLLRSEGSGFCSKHSSMIATFTSPAASTKRKRQKETAVSLLDDLSGYSETSGVAGPEEKVAAARESNATSSLYPRASAALEFEDGEDDLEQFLKLQLQPIVTYESGNESPDSEIDDPLRYAGVYSGDEAALLSREKLIRLQALYIDQFRRLQHKLQEARRQYLHEIKSTTEEDPSSLSSEEKAEIKALRRYHTRHNQESVTHEASRARSRGERVSAEREVCSELHCSERCLPLTTTCINHVLTVENQMLFNECGFNNCKRPVPAFDDRCSWHVEIGEEPVRQVPRLDPAALLPGARQNVQHSHQPAHQTSQAAT